MLTISDFLKIPSMGNSYIAAGFGGLFNSIKKLEVMEKPYPAVLEFLVPNEFYLTTLWSMSSDENRDDRIQLVRSMIEARCAGIGIMPDPNLKGEIDKEILDLANENDFPVLFVPSDVRWGDVISEYCISISSDMMPSMNSNMDLVFETFLDFHQLSDVPTFCRQLGKILKIPLILIADTVYTANVENITVASVVARIQSLSQQNRHTMSSPISVNVDNDIMAIVFFGKRSMVVACIQTAAVNSPHLLLFNKTAPWIARELDSVCSYPHPNQVSTAVKALEDRVVYYVLVKFPLQKKKAPKLDSHFVLYETNRYFNYYILLLPNDYADGDVYATYKTICDTLSPDLFVFSQQSVPFREFASKVETLKFFVNKLSYLMGVFSEDEFSLLYTLSYAPYEFKNRLLYERLGNDEVRTEEKSFFDTLRLYIVIKNISHVAGLLGIHPNSVKYRISKALKMLGYKNESVLGGSPYVNLLLQLELICL